MAYLRLAFPLWILSNILFFILLRYGAYFLALTGLSMITSNIIWVTLRNPLDLKIHFTSKDALVLSYGAAFWICLITGIVCVVLGIFVFLMDKLFPAQAAVFFGVDVLQDSENIVIEDEIEQKTAEVEVTLTQDRTVRNPAVPAAPDSDTEDDDMDGVYLKPPPPRPKLPNNPDVARPYTLRPHSHSRLTRSSEHRLTRSLQRPRRRDPAPRPPPQGEDGDTEDYSNDSERSQNHSGSTEHLLSSGSQARNPVIQYQNPGYGSVIMTGFERS